MYVYIHFFIYINFELKSKFIYRKFRYIKHNYYTTVMRHALSIPGKQETMLLC